MFRFSRYFKRHVSADTSKPQFLMIASIGNPEPEYENTRHNVGHWVLKELREYWPNFKQFSTHKNLPDGEYSLSNEVKNVMLFRSIYSYMNLQGKPIVRTWDKVKEAKVSEHSPALVILHDDMQIPLGKVQVRKQNTSARGHNGLRSIDSIMGKHYTKISIGIGRPSHDANVANYVLSRFTAQEMQTLDQIVFPKIIGYLEEMKDSARHVYESV